MASLLRLCALALVVVRSCQAMSWKMCGDGPFSTSNVALTPDPPQSGTDVDFKIQGDYQPDDGKDIPSGALDVSVNFMGTPIFQTEWDLCSKADCPIHPGDVTIQYTQNLPPIAPPGDYEVKLQAKDEDNNELFCMLVDFTIKPPSVKGFAKSIREAVQR